MDNVNLRATYRSLVAFQSEESNGEEAAGARTSFGRRRRREKAGRAEQGKTEMSSGPFYITSSRRDTGRRRENGVEGTDVGVAAEWAKSARSVGRIRNGVTSGSAKDSNDSELDFGSIGDEVRPDSASEGIHTTLFVRKTALHCTN